MKPLILTITELLLYATSCLYLSMAIFAFLSSYLDRNSAYPFALMFAPALFAAVVSAFSNKLNVFETILIADMFFYILLIPSTLTDKRLKNGNIIVLSIIALAGLILSGITDKLALLTYRPLALVTIALIFLYFCLAYRKNKADEFAKAHILNIFSLTVAIFLSNITGLFIVFILKSAYFIRLLYLEKMLAVSYKEGEDKRYELIQKDFDDEVRKRVKTQVFHMERTQERMAEIAKIDPMTGVYNKKSFLDALEDRVKDKNTKTFSLLIFDIDKFKSINDTFGHITGDKIIVRTAKLALESVRDGDMVGRYGGDEFFVLLNGADLRTAIVVAERIRKASENTENPKTTVSIGISNYPNDATTVKELISHADEGLYQAKEKGRNALGYVNKTPQTGR